jgi:hypothetical protein
VQSSEITIAVRAYVIPGLTRYPVDTLIQLDSALRELRKHQAMPELVEGFRVRIFEIHIYPEN